MRHWFIIIAIILAGLSGLTVQGQTSATLSGTVTDASGRAIAGATIAIEQTSIGTATDADGHYSFRLAVGRHIVAVSAIGFETVRSTVELNSPTTRHFTLNEQTVDLVAIDVYGKTEAQRVKEGAFTASALDVRRQAASVHDLSRLVDRTSGVKLRTEGGEGADFELSLNGLSGNSVRYFIDGVPLSTRGNATTLANLPVNLVDRVEIYKGAVPAHLGGDALGGAVDIITKRDRTNYVDASYGFGSFGTHKADLAAQYRHRSTGLIVRPSAGLNLSRNDYTMRGVELWDEATHRFARVDRRRFHDRYRSLFAQLEAGIRDRRWADELFVTASYTTTAKQLQTGTLQTVVYGLAERTSDAWTLAARYTKNDLLLPGLKASLFVSHTWDHALTIDTAFRKYRWDGSYFETSRNEINGRGRMRRHFVRPQTVVRTYFDYRIDERHSIGLNYLMNRTGNRRYDDVDATFEPSADLFARHTVGLSLRQRLAQDRWQNTLFAKNYTNYLHIRQHDLAWITGARDVAGRSVKNYTGYGLATRYAFADALTLRASYEHSMRLPMTRELLGNGTTVQPNLRLRPENSDNINIGLSGTLTPVAGHRLTFEATGFYRNVRDYIRAVVSESEGLSQYDNVAGVAIKGVEGEVRYHAGDLLQLAINGSYEDARSTTRYYPDGKEMITYLNRIPNRPWLFGNAELTLTLRNLPIRRAILRAGYTYEYVHWFYLTWEGYGTLSSKARIPEQQLHNLYLSQSLADGRYTLTLSCDNLFDRIVYDNYMLQKPGRSLFCKLRIFIN